MIVKRRYFQRKNLNLRSPLWEIKNRLIIFSVPFVLFYILIIWRMLFLAFDYDFGVQDQLLKKPHTRSYNRGEIVDRNGMVLASNLFTTSVYANPRKIENKEKTAKQIVSAISGLQYESILKLLTKDKSFVWIKRHISPKQKVAIRHLGIPGIYFHDDEKRVYPMGNLFSHVIGYVDLDAKGQFGFEMKYDEHLRAANRTALTLDFRVQNIVRNELIEAVDHYNAVGGVGLVMEIKTGKLLSVVSLPDFDPNDYSHAPAGTMVNQAFSNVYEIGSIFKVFTLSAALDSGKIKLNDVFDISKPFSIGKKFTVKDYHMSKNKAASLEEILSKSSNIGAAKIALQLGGGAFSKYIEKFMLSSKLHTRGFDTAKPIFPKRWSEVVTAAAAYGYGLAITPIHVLQAVAAIANGGIMNVATIVEEGPISHSVINNKSAAMVLNMMHSVVLKGTGLQASVFGYPIAGKTGSAEKVVNGHYDVLLNIASFVGVFPFADPQYAVFVVIDEPKTPTNHGLTGGAVAAPIVKRIIARSATVLGVNPEIQQKSILSVGEPNQKATTLAEQ